MVLPKALLSKETLETLDPTDSCALFSSVPHPEKKHNKSGKRAKKAKCEQAKIEMSFEK